MKTLYVGQELRCANVGLCMMKDAQSKTILVILLLLLLSFIESCDLIIIYSFFKFISNLPFYRLHTAGYTLHVSLGDYVKFLCPEVLGLAKEEDGVEDPETKSWSRVKWKKRDNRQFIEKIQLFTPFSLGAEFIPGREYHYICKLILSSNSCSAVELIPGAVDSTCHSSF
uniref:Ephrin RBD domain-containing protein n=1 Tax=Eptatretus burgeri TaxID=7764 RepID=A0A8C4R3C0_EPTBU